jgi:hypothetical protein
VLMKILVFTLLNDAHSCNCRFSFLDCFKSKITFFIIKYCLLVEIKHPQLFFLCYVVVVDGCTIVQVPLD